MEVVTSVLSRIGMRDSIGQNHASECGCKKSKTNVLVS